MRAEFSATKPLGWLLLALGFTALAGLSAVMMLVTASVWVFGLPAHIVRRVNGYIRA